MPKDVTEAKEPALEVQDVVHTDEKHENSAQAYQSGSQLDVSHRTWLQVAS